jgi:hypothetical protein
MFLAMHNPLERSFFQEPPSWASVCMFLAMHNPLERSFFQEPPSWASVYKYEKNSVFLFFG